MARPTADIIKEMVPLLDSTYAIRSKWRLAKTLFAKEEQGNLKKWFESATGVQGALSEVETKAEIFKDRTMPTIDPFTRVDIFETVMWPKISAYSPGWFDHPTDKSQPFGSSMKGVMYKSLFEFKTNGATAFSKTFQQVFGNLCSGVTLPGNNYLDQTTQIATDLKKLKDLSIELGGNFNHDLNNNVNNRKALANDLFSSDSAVKLWFIETVLLSESFANPFSLMGIDPFFGYLLSFSGWKGGDNVLNDVKGKVSLGGVEGVRSLAEITKKASADKWNKTDAINWYDVVAGTDGKEDSKRAYLPNFATRYLECYAAWLQNIKSENPEYYEDWYSKLVTDRFSLINMLVLINELVNVPGPANRFTYNESTTQYLTALSEKYKTFEITIGD